MNLMLGNKQCNIRASVCRVRREHGSGHLDERLPIRMSLLPAGLSSSRDKLHKKAAAGSAHGMYSLTNRREKCKQRQRAAIKAAGLRR